MVGDDEGTTSRSRVLASGMRLFGEQGYTGTRVAQIEQAAGLSPGSGALYRHFPSKRAILDAGVDAAITSGRDLTGVIDDPATLAGLPLEDRLFCVAREGLATLQEEGDLNRLLLRDLAQFEDLLERARDEQIGRFFRAFAAWLRAQPEAADTSESVDWDAVAMVLMGAVTHFWIMVDTFGTHPLGLDEERYLRAAARLGAALMQRGAS